MATLQQSTEKGGEGSSWSTPAVAREGGILSPVFPALGTEAIIHLANGQSHPPKLKREIAGSRPWLAGHAGDRLAPPPPPRL